MRIEYGDFQTPPELANQVCQKLVELGVNPDIVIEPTCGIGTFVEAAVQNFSSAMVLGIEINSNYLELPGDFAGENKISARECPC